MTRPLSEGEHDLPAPDPAPELVDGTGENYGWPVLVPPDEPGEEQGER
jgi:hypothetical protein